MLKVYAYENNCGDKGIIIAESQKNAEKIFYEKYPDRKIVGATFDSGEIQGAYLFEVGNVEHNKLYDVFPC